MGFQKIRFDICRIYPTKRLRGSLWITEPLLTLSLALQVACQAILFSSTSYPSRCARYRWGTVGSVVQAAMG